MSKHRTETIQSSSRHIKRESSHELSCSIHAPRRHDDTGESEEEIPVRDTGPNVKLGTRSECTGGAQCPCVEAKTSSGESSHCETQKKKQRSSSRVLISNISLEMKDVKAKQNPLEGRSVDHQPIPEEAHCSSHLDSPNPFELHITPHNIDSLIISALFYNQNDIIALCKDQLLECTVESALYYKYVAEKHQLTEVLPYLHDYVRLHFTSVIKTHSFLGMGVEQLKALLSDDRLKVNGELDVFFAAHTWINHNPSKRQKHTGEVMACVRFEYISPKDLLLHVEPNCQFFLEFQGLGMLLQVYRYHALQSSQSDLSATVSPNLPPARRYVPLTFKRPPKPQVIPRQPISSTEQLVSCQQKCQQVRKQVDVHFKGDGPFPEFSSSQSLYYSHHSQNEYQNRNQHQYQNQNQQQNQNHPMVQPEHLSSPTKMSRVHRDSPETRLHFRSFSDPVTRGFTVDAATNDELKLSDSPNSHHAYDKSPNHAHQRHHTASMPVIHPHHQQQVKQSSPERIRRFVDPKYAASSSRHPAQSPPEQFYSFIDHDNRAKVGGESSARGRSNLQTRRDDDGHSGSKHRPDLQRRPQQRNRDDRSLSAHEYFFRGRSQQSFSTCTVLLSIGGLNPYQVDPNVPTRLVEKYDPVSNTWSLLTKLPDPRHHQACAMLDGCLYVIGGSVVDSRDLYNMANPTSSCYRYDLAGNYWTAIAPMRSSRMYHALAVLKGVLYAIGGQTYDDNFLNTVEYYNPDSDSWGHVASLLDPTIGVAAIGFKNYVYVIGGFLELDDESIVLGSVECFDPHRNRWISRRPLPSPRCHASAVEVGARLFLLGGSTLVDEADAVQSLGSVLRYNDLDDVWETFEKMHKPRHDFGCTALGNRIYILGGVCSLSKMALQDIECLDVARGSWLQDVDPLCLPTIGLSCVAMENAPM